MYDCQNDSCHDFAYDDGPLSSPLAATQPVLKGTLVASAPHTDHLTTLEQLSRFAHQRGYSWRRQDSRLELAGVTLPDALAINTRFGGSLVISCDLRRHPPARFA
ncbi:MAG: hypothetical protein HYZ18_00640 [Pseudogulbenkiania sp.]|nr:hypothetical protein [Pseudogulbenkiania sp.]